MESGKVKQKKKNERGGGGGIKESMEGVVVAVGVVEPMVNNSWSWGVGVGWGVDWRGGEGERRVVGWGRGKLVGWLGVGRVEKRVGKGWMRAGKKWMLGRGRVMGDGW